jgi:hypothetical protein
MSKNDTTEKVTYLNLFYVRERDRGQKAIWTKVGAMFPHREGPGYNLDIQALPVNFDGKLVAMPPKDNEAGDE